MLGYLKVTDTEFEDDKLKIMEDGVDIIARECSY